MKLNNYIFMGKNKKIVSQLEIKKISENLKKKGRKIIFTNGCFDIIHIGHIKLIKKASSLGDILIIGLNSDNSVKRLKGKNRPINNFSDRAEVLSAIEGVDYIVGFSEDTPYNLIKKIRPDIIVKGGDYKVNDVIGREFAKKVYIFPLIKGKSTTKIIEKSKNK